MTFLLGLLRYSEKVKKSMLIIPLASHISLMDLVTHRISKLEVFSFRQRDQFKSWQKKWPLSGFTLC